MKNNASRRINFSQFSVVPTDDCQRRIANAREYLGERAVILAHHYQRADVYYHSDLTGDSLKLVALGGADGRRDDCFLRRAFHGRSRRYSERRWASCGAAGFSRRLFHGRYGLFGQGKARLA